MKKQTFRVTETMLSCLDDYCRGELDGDKMREQAEIGLKTFFPKLTAKHRDFIFKRWMRDNEKQFS